MGLSSAVASFRRDRGREIPGWLVQIDNPIHRSTNAGYEMRNEASFRGLLEA